MASFLNNLSDKQKNVLLVLLGSVLLVLYFFGIIQRILHLIVIFGALGLLALGLYRLNAFNRVMNLINKR